MKTIVSKARAAYASFGQKIGAAVAAPSQAQMQVGLFVVGAALVSSGLLADAIAQTGPGAYNDERVAEVTNRIFTYTEGTFGALLMVAAGIGAIFSAAVGQYKAALGLLVVAVGAFVLRSLVGTFFNDQGIGTSF